MDALGRFSEKIDGAGESLTFEMQDTQGRSVQTVVPLPALTLETPSDEIQVILDDSPHAAGENPVRAAGDAKTEQMVLPYSIKGKTEAGNRLKMDGQEVTIGKDGLFTLDLRLKEGENIYWLEINNAAGYSRYAKLTVKASLKREARSSENEAKDSFFRRIIRKTEQVYNEITKEIFP